MPPPDDEELDEAPPEDELLELVPPEDDELEEPPPELELLEPVPPDEELEDAPAPELELLEPAPPDDDVLVDELLDELVVAAPPPPDPPLHAANKPARTTATTHLKIFIHPPQAEKSLQIKFDLTFAKPITQPCEGFALH